jgi:hypothetical protein
VALRAHAAEIVLASQMLLGAKVHRGNAGRLRGGRAEGLKD